MEFLVLIIVIGIILLGSYDRTRKYAQNVVVRTDEHAASLASMVLPVPDVFRQILLKYFLFYQKLSPDDKIKFERKLVKFVRTKKYIPRGIDEVTIEAKVLIGRRQFS